jgi:hypothetical protein
VNKAAISREVSANSFPNVILFFLSWSSVTEFREFLKYIFFYQEFSKEGCGHPDLTFDAIGRPGEPRGGPAWPP